MITLDFILDNLNYNLVFDDGTILTGNIDYVTQHCADGIVTSNTISYQQLPEIKEFLADYNKHIQENGEISISEFYEIWSKR